MRQNACILVARARSILTRRRIECDVLIKNGEITRIRFRVKASMAAIPASLLRNSVAKSRAVAFVRASSPHIFSGCGFAGFFCPLRSCRSICCARAANDEEAAAKAAAAVVDTAAPTIFDKIISKEIPSTIVYEDQKVLAFRDVNPQAPVHVILIPKIRDGLTMLAKAEPKHVVILGQLLYAAKVVAEKEGILDGYRVVINNGPDGCQSVYHIHLHVLGGRQMKWPPG